MATSDANALVCKLTSRSSLPRASAGALADTNARRGVAGAATRGILELAELCTNELVFTEMAKSAPDAV